MSAALDPARIPLLVATDYNHAAESARQLNLPPERWAYLTNDDPRVVNIPRKAQVIYCGSLQGHEVQGALAASGVRTDDALFLHGDGTLAPHAKPVAPQ